MPALLNKTERKTKHKKRMQKLRRLLHTASALHVRNLHDEECGTFITSVRVSEEVEVGILSEEIRKGEFENYLCFWTSGREVRVGPLSPEQAEVLAEDLGYAAVE